MLAIAFATVTVVGITTLVLIRSLRPDRQAHGLTELAVLLSAYGAVYGPVGIGFVVQLRHGPDLSLLPPFLSGALAGALLAVLLPGGFWLAALLTLWVLRRPLELPSTRMAVRRAVLLVVALALWGIRKPWLLVGEGLRKEMPYAEVKAVLAHEIGHVIRRDHVRLLLSGLAWAAAITVCSRLVLLPLLQADRAITFITVLATFNTLYLGSCRRGDAPHGVRHGSPGDRTAGRARGAAGLCPGEAGRVQAGTPRAEEPDTPVGAGSRQRDTQGVRGLAQRSTRLGQKHRGHLRPHLTAS